MIRAVRLNPYQRNGNVCSWLSEQWWKCMLTMPIYFLDWWQYFRKWQWWFVLCLIQFLCQPLQKQHLSYTLTLCITRRAGRLCCLTNADVGEIESAIDNVLTNKSTYKQKWVLIATDTWGTLKALPVGPKRHTNIWVLIHHLCGRSSGKSPYLWKRSFYNMSQWISRKQISWWTSKKSNSTF